MILSIMSRALMQAFDDVSAVLRLLEPELRTTGDDLDLMVDVGLQRGDEVERARHAVDQRDHVHAEAGLQLRVLEQVVQHDQRVGVALETDDQLGVDTGGKVVERTDALDLAVVDEFGDAGRRSTLIDAWYGSSETTIEIAPFLSSSISALART